MKNGIHSLMFRKVTANIICFPLSLLVDIGRVLTSQGVSPYKRCNWLQLPTSLWKRPWWILQQFEWKGAKKKGFFAPDKLENNTAEAQKERARKKKGVEEKKKKKVVTLLGFILATLEIIFDRNGEIGIGAFQILIV